MRLRFNRRPRINSVFWIAEIHELIAGAELENIKAAFTPEGRSPNGPPEYENIFWAEKVENVAQALSNIFNYGLKSWQDPRDTAGARGESGTKSKWRVTSSLFGPADVTRALWEEYYQWRFALPANICLIRYGCDRHFNKLAKEPRLIKAPKKHPYPHWLEPYFIGGPRWEKGMWTWQRGVDRPRRVRVTKPDPDYFNLEDDDEQ